MAEESFLLMSLDDDKSKKLAQVISNDTSRKILNVLSKKDMTESEISKELKMPLSTIHYNLKALEQANLVKADEFHYSEKGKEVNHYSLTNKLVIIAPSKDESIMSKLKNLIPSVFVSIAGAAALFFAGFFRNRTDAGNLAFSAQRSLGDAVPKAAVLAEDSAYGAVGGAVEAMNDTAMQTVPEAFTTISEPGLLSGLSALDHNAYLWFLAGALVFGITLAVTIWIKNRVNNK